MGGWRTGAGAGAATGVGAATGAGLTAGRGAMGAGLTVEATGLAGAAAG